MVHAPYDSFDYPSYWTGREYEDEAEKIALTRFLQKIPQKNSLIDIGGGYGRHAPSYFPLFKQCLLVDPSEKLLGLAREKMGNFPHFKTKKGRGDSLPVQDDQFDVALLIRVVHHLPDLLPTFSEIARVLKPDGFLILEFANKIHCRANLRAWLKGDPSFVSNQRSVDQRSQESIAQESIPFLNHHPRFISHSLEKAGFKIIDRLSVSNFRHPILKKLFPHNLLITLETACQKPLAKCSFGPSIFLLAQKQEKSK